MTIATTINEKVLIAYRVSLNNPVRKREKMSLTITVEARTIGQKNPSDTSWELFIGQIQVKYTLQRADHISGGARSRVL